MSRTDGEAGGRRRVELVVLSDLHLGTVGCQAKPLLRYLKSIEPGTLVLNGDVIDCWQFSRWYWPKAHMKVVQRILKMIAAGIPVYYVTGNHDEMLRRFADLHLGAFHLVNKVVLELDGRRAWIFHGDVFDVVMQHSRWLVKLGSLGYDLLILINRVANALSECAGQGRISLSKRIKDGVKRAVSFIGDFERTAASLAAEGGYDYAVCGHIHQPAIKTVAAQGSFVTYLNSGDWVENLTALEYDRGRWTLFRYRDHEQELERHAPADEPEPDEEIESLSLPAASALLHLVRP